jgi:Uma2 family endonuclease
MIAHVPVRAGKDDLIRVSEANPGWKVELEPDGTLVMSPPAGMSSSRRNLLLTLMINAWAEEHDYVGFDSSAGFELPDKSVRSPDAALVRRADWLALSAAEQDSFGPLVPAIAIELASKTDRPARLAAKLRRMRELGTEYVVLIDPYRREVWTDGVRPPDFPDDFSHLFDVTTNP